MTLNPHLRVAVIIPVYRARFLEEAIESVIGQNRPADEIIVVDDGSPEQDVVERVRARWPREIRLVRQANAGAGAARNAGMETAASEWAAFLDADDRWHPDFLRRQMAFLAARSGTDLVWADATIIGDTPIAGRTFMSMCPSSGPVTLERLLAQTCNVLTSTVIVRRVLVTAAGGFDVSLRRGQDFDLWLRLVARGASAAYQRDVLGARRMHGENLSGTRLNELERALDVFSKALMTLTLTSREREAAWRRMQTLRGELAREHGKARLRRGDFRAARLLLDTAQRQAPSWKVRAAQIGLRLAPELVRRLYATRTPGDLASAIEPAGEIAV
jgi:Glycosyl transferase family 2